MAAKMYHWTSLRLQAGHRILIQPARLPQFKHLIATLHTGIRHQFADHQQLRSFRPARFSQPPWLRRSRPIQDTGV